MPDENAPSQAQPVTQTSSSSPISDIIPSADAGINSENSLDKSLRDTFKNEGVKVDSNDEESSSENEPESQKASDTTETKPETEVKPADPKKSDDETPPVDPETIKPPKNISPKMLEGWNHLKKNNTRAWNALSRATDENKKLKQALADRSSSSTSEMEALKKENEELRGIRAMVDYEHDPEFIKNYEEPAELVKNRMIAMLNELNVRKDVIDQVDYSDPRSVAAVAAVIRERVDEITANRFIKRGEEYVDLMEKRQQVLDDHRGNYKKYFEERRKKTESSTLEDQARIMKRVDDISSIKDEKGNPKYPFISKLEIPPTANKAQISQIESHNKVVEGMRSKLDDLLKKNTPEDRAEIAVAAVAAAWLSQSLQAAQAKVKSLEDTLKKYNDVSSDRGTTAVHSTYKKTESLDLEDALNSAFPQYKSKL